MSENPWGSARHYGVALDAIRARMAHLRIALPTLDALLGLPERYSSKCLCVPPVKFYSRDTLLDAFVALGIPLVPVEDAELTARTLAHRDFKHHSGAGPAMRGSARMKVIPTEYLRLMASQGGHARAAAMTEEQLSRAGRKAARARWAAVRASGAG